MFCWPSIRLNIGSQQRKNNYRDLIRMPLTQEEQKERKSIIIIIRRREYMNKQFYLFP